MTSLIDVIFLLLLFFMLSSTFTRFAEIPLTGVSGGGSARDETVMFLRLGAEDAQLNGQRLSMDETVTVLKEFDDDSQRTLLVTTTDEVSTQRLVDLLIALSEVSGLKTQVLR